MSTPAAPPLPPKTRRGADPDPAQRHVVKIRIGGGEDEARVPAVGCVRICVGADTSQQPQGAASSASSHYFFCSSESSPSDTLDSGTCSDLEGGTPPPPPPPPKKRSPAPAAVSVRRAGSLSSGADVDSDDERISCDSLNSDGELFEARSPLVLTNGGAARLSVTDSESSGPPLGDSPLRQGHPSDDEHDYNHDGCVTLSQHVIQDLRENTSCDGFLLQEDLHPHDDQSSGGRLADDDPLQDLREDTSRLTVCDVVVPARSTRSWVDATSPGAVVQQRTYEDRRQECLQDSEPREPAVCYKFHVNERFDEPVTGQEDSFAGYKDLLEGASTIRSAKGTVRGVRNRVRAGITTFLQLHATKSYKEKEVGKVVLYTTTMGVVRKTYQDCVKVKKILRNLMVKYEERDVFMSREVQAEIRERMKDDLVVLPQMFVEGQLVGDAEAIEKLNESGELRRFLKPYRSPSACNECHVCGGHRLLPCPICNGSKKSVHRNHFTAEFVALKCMNCDEVGLVRCHAC